jgi:AbrB family looped-hinge helix DNA binding protein
MDVVKVAAKGRVVIPARRRRQVRLEPGQKVLVSVEHDRIILWPIPHDLVERMSGCLAGGPSLIEELLREHAEELRKEGIG